MSTSTDLPVLWHGIIDDAAIFPPGNSPLPDAVMTWSARQDAWYAPLAATFVVTDARLNEIAATLPVSIVVTRSIEAALAQAGRSPATVAGLEFPIRDDNVAQGASRIVNEVLAARAAGLLDEDVPVFVELPQGPATAPWLEAADVVARARLQLKFRTGGIQSHLYPTSSEIAAWIAAATERSTPFKCTAGLHRAVRHTGDDGFEHHGFLNVILATALTVAGASLEDVINLLEQRDGVALATIARNLNTDGALSVRDQFTSYGSCSVLEPLTDLLQLNLLEEPQ